MPLRIKVPEPDLISWVLAAFQMGADRVKKSVEKGRLKVMEETLPELKPPRIGLVEDMRLFDPDARNVGLTPETLLRTKLPARVFKVALPSKLIKGILNFVILA